MAAIEHYNNPLVVGDNSAPTGTLAGAITNVSTAMSCSGLTSMVPNFRVAIENELILVTANIAGVQFITRGIEGTTAVAHEDGSSVYPVVTAASLVNNPLALTTSGDLPYLDASLNQARLAIGSATGILSSEAGIPSWVTATGTGAPVRATSPTLATPTLGVAAATSLAINSSVLVGGASGNTLEQRNSTNGQTLNIYGTYTDASNYEALQVKIGTSEGLIEQVKGGTGTLRPLRIRAGTHLQLNSGGSSNIDFGNAGTYYWRIDASFLAITDNANDIGASASQRPRTGYFGTSIYVGSTGTAEKLRLVHDTSNYVSHTVSSVGSLTVAPTGTNPSITLTPAGTGVVNLTRTVFAAGAAAAGAAPLKLTSGTNLTTAEAGALEYNGTNLFFTRAGTTRETVMVGLTGTAPATSIGVGIVNYYGTAATNFLGDPVAWMLQNYGGTVYKIPLYT